MINHHLRPTLVMGPAGNVGRLVLDRLLAHGLPVRASVRGPRPGQTPPGVEVCTADLADPASLVPAFAGMEQVFLDARLDGVHAVVDAARAAGVRRVVLLSSGSVVHPVTAGNAIMEEPTDSASATRWLRSPPRLGEEVAVGELSRSAALAPLRRFMPPVEVEAVLQFLDDAADGASPATDTVEHVLGPPCRGAGAGRA